MNIFPTRDAFVVRVRDPRQPRGKRMVSPDRYFTDKPKAEAHRAAMRAQFPDAAITVELLECLV